MDKKITFLLDKVETAISSVHRRLNYFMIIDVALIIINVLYFSQDITGKYNFKFMFLHLVGHSISIILGIISCFINIFIFTHLMDIDYYKKIIKTINSNSDMIIEMETAHLSILDTNIRLLYVIQYFTCAILCLLLLCLC